jgi:hypothetical protein
MTGSPQESAAATSTSGPQWMLPPQAQSVEQSVITGLLRDLIAAAKSPAVLGALAAAVGAERERAAASPCPILHVCQNYHDECPNLTQCGNFSRLPPPPPCPTLNIA